MTNPNLSFKFVQKQLQNPPYWSQEKLLAWDKAYPRDSHNFLKRHYWTAEASVNVFNVVGTDHWDYQGKTWLDFLQGGKRMPLNLQSLESNPDYYLSLINRNPHIHYYTTDGLEFYVGSDGNHRTCLARFFLFEQAKAYLHCVTIDHFQVDWVFYEIYQQLKQVITEKQLPYEITSNNQSIGREDTAGWKTDLFEPSITLKDRETFKEYTLNYEQSQGKLAEFHKRIATSQSKITPSLWKRLFK